MEPPLGVTPQSVAVLAVHEDVAPGLELVQHAELDVEHRRPRAAAGAEGHLVAGRLEGADHHREPISRCPGRREPLPTSRHVLDVAGVALHAAETQAGAAGHEPGDGRRLVRAEHPCAPESHVDVAEHGDLHAGSPDRGGQFAHPHRMVHDDGQLAPCGQRRSPLRRRRSDDRRGEQYRDLAGEAILGQPVDEHLGLREFGAGQPDRTVFELEPGDECRLVRLHVRAETQPACRGHVLHHPDVVRQEIEVAENRRCGDPGTGPRPAHAVERTRDPPLVVPVPDGHGPDPCIRPGRRPPSLRPG